MSRTADPELLASFPLDGRTVSLGRDPSCDVRLSGIGVSRHHATLHLDAAKPYIVDNKSSYGTRIDDTPVTTDPLYDGAVLAVGVVRLRVKLAGGQLRLYRSVEPPAAPQHPAPPGDVLVVTVGRDRSNTLHCPHPLVSRYHASIRRLGTRRVLIDHQSANGTFVNGRPVRQAELADDDVVQIGPYRFFVQDGELVRADDFDRVKVEAFGLTVTRGGTAVLDNVSLSIQPGEFVAVLGPSGAGKTTLAHALTGQVTPAGGAVFINGLPLAQFCRAFSSSIGYVSQQNVLHYELTVYETFHQSSVLRLPADSLPAERRERINEVMELLDLSRLAGRQVRRLSGGEAKRVHVGVELISSPALVILDEPLAGLDTGLVRSFMGLFRRICDRGHTVVLTTHALESVELCDRILFVDKGRIRYQGSARELMASLGLRAIADLYERSVEESVRGQDRRGTAAAAASLSAEHGATERSAGADELPLMRQRRPLVRSALMQLATLVGRYATILSRDRRNLAIVFSQAPLITLLLGFVFERDTSFLPISFYFCIAISAIWVGGVNSVREVARDREILRREYRAGLSLTAYAVSKVIVFGALALVQAGLFACLLRLLFATFVLDWTSMALLSSATLGGTLLGLAISSLGGTVSRAVSWLPIAFIPQIFFSGVLMPFDRMAAVGEWLSYATVSRPVFSLLKRTRVLELDMWCAADWLDLASLVTSLFILLIVSLHLGVARRRDH